MPYAPARYLSVALATVTLITLSATARANELEIHGSNTIGAHLAPALIEGYLEAQGGTGIATRPGKVDNEQVVTGNLAGRPFEAKVAAHGSGTGFSGLKSGESDIAAASRPAKEKEVALLAGMADLRDKASEHVIAIDGLAILVHPDNPIAAMDKKALARIFAGEITNWKMLGGPDRAIQVYARDENSGTWDTFKSLVLGKAFPLSPKAKRYESNDLLSDDVSRDPEGIGFTGLASVRQSKVLAISDGDSAALLPSQLNVATEDYPLSRRLFFYSLGAKDKGPTTDFLTFSQGQSGQKIVEETGYVSQNIQAVDATFDAQVPASLKSLTRNYQRLSVNFRFSEGRTKLDNKANRDLERLKQFLEMNNASGSDLMLIGYADKQSNELRAQMISELRALSVKKALRKEQNIELKAYTGYGQYVPVGDSGGETGANRNGRVEVWFRKQG